jgi:Zn-finger nucleic acid-binding protein
VVKRKIIEAQVCAACGAVWIARKDGVLRSMGLKDWSRMKQHERRQIQNARGRRT